MFDDRDHGDTWVYQMVQTYEDTWILAKVANDVEGEGDVLEEVLSLSPEVYELMVKDKEAWGHNTWLFENGIFSWRNGRHIQWEKTVTPEDYTLYSDTLNELELKRDLAESTIKEMIQDNRANTESRFRFLVEEAAVARLSIDYLKHNYGESGE